MRWAALAAGLLALLLAAPGYGVYAVRGGLPRFASVVDSAG